MLRGRDIDNWFVNVELTCAMYSAIRFEYVCRGRLTHDYVLQTH